MSLDKQIIKSRIRQIRNKSIHPSQNRIKIKSLMFCEKCKVEAGGNKVTGWRKCSSLYKHYVICHQFDKYDQPSLSDCLNRLSFTSEKIISGELT